MEYEKSPTTPKSELYGHMKYILICPFYHLYLKRISLYEQVMKETDTKNIHSQTLIYGQASQFYKHSFFYDFSMQLCNRT